MLHLWVKHEDGYAGPLVLDAGVLSGDWLAVRTIQMAAALVDDGLSATPSGPFFPKADLLTDPVAFWLLSMRVFTSVDVQRDGEDPSVLLDGLMYPDGTDADTVF